jgi:hypothetical protein
MGITDVVIVVVLISLFGDDFIEYIMARATTAPTRQEAKMPTAIRTARFLRL